MTKKEDEGRSRTLECHTISTAGKRQEGVFWHRIKNSRSADPFLQIKSMVGGWKEHTCGRMEGRTWRTHNAFVICIYANMQKHVVKNTLTFVTCKLLFLAVLWCFESVMMPVGTIKKGKSVDKRYEKQGIRKTKKESNPWVRSNKNGGTHKQGRKGYLQQKRNDEVPD